MPAHRPPAFPGIISAVFLGVTVLMLAIAAISAVNSARVLSREISAPGSVIDLVVRQDPNGDLFYYPVVAFMLPDGSRETVQVAEGGSQPAYQPDESVTVAYDPQQPRNARIKSFSSTTGVWILPMITGILGLAFLAATLFARSVLASDSEKVRQKRAR